MQSVKTYMSLFIGRYHSCQCSYCVFIKRHKPSQSSFQSLTDTVCLEHLATEDENKLWLSCAKLS